MSIASSPSTVITSIHTYIRPHLPEIHLYFQMNLHSLKLPDKTSLPSPPPVASKSPLKMDAASPSAPSRASILRRWMLHYLLLRARRGSFGEATVQDRSGQRVLPWGGAPECMIFTSPDSILKRDTRPKDQGLKKDFRGHQRSRLLDTTTAETISTDLQKTDAAPSAAASSPGNPRGSDGPSRGGSSRRRIYF